MDEMEGLSALCGRPGWRSHHAGEGDQGAIALALDVAKAFG